jgi:phosphoheptose isomerase
VLKSPYKKTKHLDKFTIKYFKTFNAASQNIKIEQVTIIYKIILDLLIKNKKIFIAGNGGAAAVANHFVTDFNKSVTFSTRSKLKPRFTSLSNSVETITTVGNDFGYKYIFLNQLEALADRGDGIILLNCSGNSSNIINAANTAKKKGLKIIFLTGFEKTKINDIKYYIDLNCQNYGITENLFSSLLHIISQFLRFSFSKRKEIL